MPADLDAELVRVFDVFRSDLRKYEAAVLRALPNAKQHEFDAAVSFHYNTGAIGEARWVKKLAAGDVAGAARSIMSWTKNKELTDRREAERDLLLLGKYPLGEITIFGVTDAGRVIWKPVRMIAAEDALAMLRPVPVSQPVAPSWLAGIIAAIAALFGRK